MRDNVAAQNNYSLIIKIYNYFAEWTVINGVEKRDDDDDDDE